ARWRREGGTPPPRALDEVHRALDAVTALLAGSSPQRVEAPAPAVPGTAASPAADHVPSEEPPRERPMVMETVRVPVAKLDTSLLDAEEMLAAKLTLSQRTADLRYLASYFEEWSKEWALVEPDVRHLRHALE